MSNATALVVSLLAIECKLANNATFKSMCFASMVTKSATIKVNIIKHASNSDEINYYSFDALLKCCWYISNINKLHCSLCYLYNGFVLSLYPIYVVQGDSL